MATSNVNKLVRGNINLKPWILNKSPTDIVNSYVQQLYKQVPDTYKKDLFKPRSNAPQLEKRAPFRFPFPIINQPKKTPRPSLYRAPPVAAGNKVQAAQKKFLKSPSYKIYGSRKFSSASSSGVSHFRDSEERRKQSYKPNTGIQVRTYAGTATVSNFYSPVRVYNEVSKQMKCLEITNNICKDLMSVDKLLKEQLRVVKPKGGPMRPELAQMSKQDALEASFRGWNHPTLSLLNRIDLQSPPSKKTTSARPTSLDKSPPKTPTTSFGLRPSYFKSMLLPSTPRKENARFEVNNIPRYYGIKPTTSRSAKGEDWVELNKRVPDPRYSQTKSARVTNTPSRKETLDETNEKIKESRYYETRPSGAKPVKRESLTDVKAKAKGPRYYGARPSTPRQLKTSESLIEVKRKPSEARYNETIPKNVKPLKKASLADLKVKGSEPQYSETKHSTAKPVKKLSSTKLNEQLTEPKYRDTRPTATASARPTKKETFGEFGGKDAEPQNPSSYGQNPTDLVCRSRPQRTNRMSSTLNSIPRRVAAVQSVRRS